MDRGPGARRVMTGCASSAGARVRSRHRHHLDAQGRPWVALGPQGPPAVELAALAPHRPPCPATLRLAAVGDDLDALEIGQGIGEPRLERRPSAGDDDERVGTADLLAMEALRT